MWQELVVALVVLVAAVYIGARYLPAAWRIRIVNRLSRGGTDSMLVRWLDTADSCGGGCKTCHTCETPAEPTPPAGGTHRVIKLHEKR
jgi:hypothetical protein